MLIQFNGVFLTNDGSGTYPERAITSAQQFQLDGKQNIQVAEFIRGITAIPYARQNKLSTLRFKVTRNFALINPADTNPIATCEQFALTDFSLRAQNGILFIYCGPIGGSPQLCVQATNAVLESSPSIDATGVRLSIDYSIQCSTLFVAPAPGSTLTDQSGNPLTDQSGNPLTG
jgi:hypothetical protein